MKRLIEKNINTVNEYNRIFKIREQKGVDEFDLRRWKTLLKYYLGGSLLDIGCLDSLIPPLAWAKFPEAEIIGIDIASKAIEEMKIKYPICKWEVRNCYNTGFEAGKFDYVVAGEIIEHLENPTQFILEALRILKSGGVLAISTPLDEAKEPGAVDGDRHLWSFNEQDMHDLFDIHGKIEIEILRSIQEPVYKYCWPQMICFCQKN